MKKIIKFVISLLGILAGGAAILHFGKKHINSKEEQERNNSNKCY